MWVVAFVLLLLQAMMGLIKSKELVPGADLGLFTPPPWPAAHTDKEGRVLAYKEGGRYMNPWMTERPSVTSFFLSWFKDQDLSAIPSQEVLDRELPIEKPAWNEMPSDARMTWLGHATVLAEVDGQTYLTDPIFSSRASAVQIAGPARYRAAACTVRELPMLTAVLISHSHYDHLDLNSVQDIAKLQPQCQFFVPMGMKEWMMSNTAATTDRVHELSWWDQHSLDNGSTTIAFTPANHWCKRSVNDDNYILWGSWAVKGPKNSFWFGGDTGYCEAFKQIGDTYGPFSMAAIPIGAYQPNWFMKYQHVHPGEAVEIHKDIRSNLSLGIHWGTFKLTTEYYLEPPSLLTTFLQRNSIPLEQFRTTHIGGSIQP